MVTMIMAYKYESLDKGVAPLSSKPIYKPSQVSPVPGKVYVNYKNEILPTLPFEGYTVKDLSYLTGMTVASIERFIRRGELPNAWRDQDNWVRAPYIVPFDEDVIKVLERRSKYLSQGRFKNKLYTDAHGVTRTRRILAKRKIVDGVMYRFCEACITERKLTPQEAWQPEDAAHFHKQKEGYFSICKKCRSQRMKKANKTLIIE